MNYHRMYISIFFVKNLKKMIFKYEIQVIQGIVAILGQFILLQKLALIIYRFHKMESHIKSKSSAKHHLPTYQGQPIRKSQLNNRRNDYLNRRVITESSEKCVDAQMKKIVKQFKLPFKSTSPKQKKNLTHKDSMTFFKKKSNVKSPHKTRGVTETGQIIKHAKSGVFDKHKAKEKKPQKKHMQSMKIEKKKSADHKLHQQSICKTKANIHKTMNLKTEGSFDSTSSCMFGSEVQIIQLIGQGTFGKVFKGKLKSTGQLVAIKRVLQDKKYKNRELEIVSMLDGDFVMKIYGTNVSYDQNNQYLNIIMKYYEGDLYHRIRKSKKNLTDMEIKLYMFQIFRSLMYIHSLGICHRDIKPHNLLVQGMHVALCDFGSAKIIHPNQNNLPYICSRCYRAPQLIFGATQYTTMIDIWSVGCVLLEMLNSVPLFIGQSSVDHLIQIIKVMGTPTKSQVIDMNPNYDLNDYKFPKIKKKEWIKVFPKAQPMLIDLISQIMIYSPKQRLNAAQAICHEYFDDLREEHIYKKVQKQYKIPFLFNYKEHQLIGHQHLIPKLIPHWVRNQFKKI